MAIKIDFLLCLWVRDVICQIILTVAWYIYVYIYIYRYIQHYYVSAQLTKIAEMLIKI